MGRDYFLNLGIATFINMCHINCMQWPLTLFDKIANWNLTSPIEILQCHPFYFILHVDKIGKLNKHKNACKQWHRDSKMSILLIWVTELSHFLNRLQQLICWTFWEIVFWDVILPRLLFCQNGVWKVLWNWVLEIYSELQSDTWFCTP